MDFRRSAFRAAATAAFLALAGCSSPVVKAPSDGTGGTTTTPLPDGGADADAQPDAQAQSEVNPDSAAAADADASFCCPIDQVPTSCAHLGGARAGSFSCGEVCDFWCSYNWRVEKDESGCDVWRMDYRMPAPGENDLCFPVADGAAASDGQADGG